MSAENKIAIIEIGSELWSSTKAAGSWLGGALQGEFNEKSTLGQIVFDAVISMFPVAGEATAVRDLIAISNRMAGSEQEKNKVLNWVSIILCLLPLIPIFGGVLKGIGRLLITVIKDASKAAEVAIAILAFLRKMGYGDPIKFINALKFSKYQAKILSEFKNFIARLKSSIQFFLSKTGVVLPKHVQQQLNSFLPELDKLAKLADKMIPSAIKELDSALNKVRSEMINQMNKAGAKIGGGETKVLTTEARLASTARNTIPSKGHKPTPLSHYKHKKGWPDLSNSKLSWIISTFSIQRRITPKIYGPGTRVNLSRVLDKERPTTKGLFWGNKLPKNGTEWRFDCAVLSNWSDNGIYVQLTRIPTIAELKKLGIKVSENWKGLKVWEGGIAEQMDFEKGVGSKLLLPGGDTQIVIDFNHPDNIPIAEYIDKVIKIQNTNWKDAILPKDTTETVEYLLNREASKKTVQQGQILRATSSTSRANSRESSSNKADR
ncbi:hypothetical protein [Acinetobacter indicus]|uniref:hypothetical protein n=4 Tax=Acinetobacter indicus TaxID=756892 RepID=UPI000CEC00B1|nr:hypothetical protein [Acinetobacter indicus]MCO8089677.1 hypothetical protein [Acinetobacter indicus]